MSVNRDIISGNRRSITEPARLKGVSPWINSRKIKMREVMPGEAVRSGGVTSKQ